jgi:hypothetical protein
MFVCWSAAAVSHARQPLTSITINNCIKHAHQLHVPKVAFALARQ